MVAAALVLRGAIDGDDDGGDGVGGDTKVVCATDLLDACRALGDEVDVELSASGAAIAASIADSSLPDDIDALILTTAWIEVINSRNPDALGDVEALARTPTVVATAPGRSEAITELCEGEDVWSCLGGAAGEDWGDLGIGDPQWRELKVGLTNPDLATGLAVLASAAAGFFGGTEFAANDLPELESWLAVLAEPSGDRDANPALTLATRPGTYSAAGSVAAVTDALDARGVETLDPDVPVVATVAVVAVNGRDRLPNVGRARDALLDDGWSRATDDDLAPTLKPGVMAALHTLWRAVTS